MVDPSFKTWEPNTFFFFSWLGSAKKRKNVEAQHKSFFYVFVLTVFYDVFLHFCSKKGQKVQKTDLPKSRKAVSKRGSPTHFWFFPFFFAFFQSGCSSTKNAKTPKPDNTGFWKKTFFPFFSTSFFNINVDFTAFAKVPLGSLPPLEAQPLPT